MDYQRIPNAYSTTDIELMPLDSSSSASSIQHILEDEEENNSNNDYSIHDISAVVKSLKDSTHFFQVFDNALYFEH